MFQIHVRLKIEIFRVQRFFRCSGKFIIYFIYEIFDAERFMVVFTIRFSLCINL